MNETCHIAIAIHQKGFSCVASCKSRGAIKRTGGEHKGKKVKSKKYGGSA